jgi:hypothetical protein
VARLGIGYFSGANNRATETTTSVGTSTVTTAITSISTETSAFTQGILAPISSASTLNPVTGISLGMNLSGSTGGQLFVTVYEFNTLDRANNVSFGESPLLNSSFFQWTKCDGGGCWYGRI